MKVDNFKYRKGVNHAAECIFKDTSHIKIELIDGVFKVTRLDSLDHSYFVEINLLHVTKAKKKPLAVICPNGEFIPVAELFGCSSDGVFIVCGYFNPVTEKRIVCLAPSDVIEIKERLS